MESGTELYQYKLLRGAGLLRPVVFLKFFPSFFSFGWMFALWDTNIVQ
jgi:hypothetical protein